MKNYLTVFIPSLGILKTLYDNITELDGNKKILYQDKIYYYIEPGVYMASCGFSTAIEKKYIDKYDYEIINEYNEIESILKYVKSNIQMLGNMSNLLCIVVSYIGNCENYEGEKIALEQMQNYIYELQNKLDNFKMLNKNN